MNEPHFAKICRVKSRSFGHGYLGGQLRRQQVLGPAQLQYRKDHCGLLDFPGRQITSLLRRSRYWSSHPCRVIKGTYVS